MGLQRSDMVFGTAQYFFTRGWSEAFARHIRAVERELIYEWAIGLGRIHVQFSSKLDPGEARMTVSEARYSMESFEETGSELASPVVDLGVRSDVYIICGIKGLVNLKGRLKLSDLEKMQLMKPRLAVAHELGHLVLGHCIRRPYGLHVPYHFDVRQETEAYAYAVILVKLVADYLSKRADKLIDDPAAMAATAKELWPHFLEESKSNPGFVQGVVDMCQIEELLKAESLWQEL